MLPTCCALYSCALAVEPRSATAMTRPVMRRRCNITGPPPSPSEDGRPRKHPWRMKRERRGRGPTASSLLTRGPCCAEPPEAHAETVPVGKRTAPEVQEKVAPPEGRYKANLAVPAPGPLGLEP